MSDGRFEFRIREKLKEQFQSLAKKNKTTASKLLVNWIRNYVASASLTPSELLIEHKLLLPGQPEAIADRGKPLPSNESGNSFANPPVQNSNNCTGSAVNDFHQELAELKQELELLKTQYRSLDQALKASMQDALVENMQSIITGTIDTLRTQHGWRSPQQNTDAIQQNLDEKLRAFEINYMQENKERLSTQVTLLQKVVALEKFASSLGYKVERSPKPKGKGFQP